MKFDANFFADTPKLIWSGFCIGAGIGLWQLAARSIDFLNKLAW